MNPFYTWHMSTPLRVVRSIYEKTEKPMQMIRFSGQMKWGASLPRKALETPFFKLLQFSFCVPCVSFSIAAFSVSSGKSNFEK